MSILTCVLTPTYTYTSTSLLAHSLTHLLNLLSMNGTRSMPLRKQVSKLLNLLSMNGTRSMPLRKQVSK